MSFIHLPSRWRRQPTYAARLNLGNYFAQKVLAAYPLWNLSVLGRSSGFLTVGAGAYAVSPILGAQGEPLNAFLNNGSSYLQLPASPFKDATSPVSIGFYVRSTSTSNAYQGFFSSKAPGAANPTCLGWSTASNYELYVGSQASNGVAQIGLGINAVNVPRRGLVVMTQGPTSAVDKTHYVGYLDGVGSAIGESTGGWTATTNDIQRIGDDGQNSKWSGYIGDIVVFDGAFSAAEAWEYIRAPYQIYEPSVRRIYVPSAGTTGTTLTAAVGSYSLTGTAATLKAARKLAVDVGSYTKTGTAAALRRGNSISAAAGSYTLTGTAATLKKRETLAAAVGSYTINGTAAALRRGNSIGAAIGSYSLSGTAAALRIAWKLPTAVGSYTLTGTAATLTYTSLPGTYTLPANAGSYTLTGTAAGLVWKHALSVSVGSYTVSGTTTSLFKGSKLAAAAGSYTLSGTAVTFPRVYVIAAAEGIYTISGTAAAFTYSGAVVPPAPPSFAAGGGAGRRKGTASNLWSWVKKPRKRRPPPDLVEATKELIEYIEPEIRQKEIPSYSGPDMTAVQAEALLADAKEVRRLLAAYGEQQEKEELLELLEYLD